MEPDLTQVKTVAELDAEWLRNEAVYYWATRQHSQAVEQYLSGSVLDIGCGPGYLAARVKPNEGWYTGVDISPTAISLGKRLFPGAHFHVLDVEHDTLPFTDRSFDTVAASEVFEHLQTHKLLLSEIRRVARTYIVITVPISMGGVGHVWPQWTYQDCIDKFGCLGAFMEIRRLFEPPGKFTLCHIRARAVPTKGSLLR